MALISEKQIQSRPIVGRDGDLAVEVKVTPQGELHVENMEAEALLHAILLELKIMNLHLAEVTGDNIESGDIE